MCVIILFFFFKQKTAYEMRISDWSSDVCSSDLPVVKIYTTITDCYAPLHQTVIAGTAGEAIHALDGLLGHDRNADLTALHVDGGGVSDIVFATMHLLGLDFEPRIPRLSDRRLYAFEPSKRYGRLPPPFGHSTNRDRIISPSPNYHPPNGRIPAY